MFKYNVELKFTLGHNMKIYFHKSCASRIHVSASVHLYIYNIELIYKYHSNTYSKEFTYSPNSPMDENIPLYNTQHFLNIPMMQYNIHTFK